MSRAAVFSLLSADTQLQALGINTGTVYGSNAVDTPDAKPFVILHWGMRAREFGLVGDQNLTVWAHDEPADYARINEILERVKAILTSAVHVDGGDGTILTLATWNGDSDDFYDDGYETVSKNSGFVILSRKA